MCSLRECEHGGRSSRPRPCIVGCRLLVLKNARLQAKVKKGGYVKRPGKLTITLPYSAALCSANDPSISPVVDEIPYLQCCLPSQALISLQCSAPGHNCSAIMNHANPSLSGTLISVLSRAADCFMRRETVELGQTSP